jgi:exodeoxyribonuclease VII small subunit
MADQESTGRRAAKRERDGERADAAESGTPDAPGDPGEPGDLGEPDEPTDPLGYEQARDELIDVVRRLETGGATLEESLALWERGEHLAKVCRHWLEGARQRLDAALAAEAEPASPEEV